MQDSHWSNVFKSISDEKIGQARLAGTKVVNSHESATIKEIELLSLCCILEGSTKFADFFALNRSLYHLVARCCEASAMKKSTLTVKQVYDDLVTYNCIMVPVERNKTQTRQELIVYSHKCSYKLCAYFGLAYKLALDNGYEDALFPKFYKSLKKEESIQIESNASAVFSKYYSELVALANNFNTDFDAEEETEEKEPLLNEGLTSHVVGKFLVFKFIE